MARITKAHLDSQLRTAAALGGYAEGPYPTPGQLVINHSGYGYSVDLVVNDGGGQADLSPCGLTAKELDIWFSGFNAGLDSKRRKAHWLGV
jgi:hypothetical protein